MEGGSKAGLKSINYKEVRKFTKAKTVITFYFVTRCYGEYMKSIIASLEAEPPDVVIMNSCLWDLCRYGKNANSEFKTNINELLEEIGLMIPYDSERMFIWNATLPVVDSNKSSCAPCYFPQGFQPENEKVRNANLYVRDQMVDYGDHFIFLDLYDIFHYHREHRIFDGVHWDSFAHRKITHLLLTEISLQWDIELPAKENSSSLGTMTIKSPLVSTPPIGTRHPIGSVPNHALSTYGRPSPSVDHLVNYPRQFSLTGSRVPTLGQPPVGPPRSIPRPKPNFPFPLHLLTRPFSPRPYVFGAGPTSWRTVPLNVHNAPLPGPEVNWLVNRTSPPLPKKRKCEEDVCSDYKRPRKFL